jgi:hypothetical protein
MSDAELLFLVLALVYGWECACWIPKGSVAFRTWFGHKWRILHPGSMLGNQKGGFIFAHALPPLGTFITGTQIPVSISPVGVLGFVSPTINPGWRPRQTGKFFRFDDCRTIDTRGKKVRVNGELLVKAASTGGATHLARQLNELKKLEQGKRAGAIEDLLQASLDRKAVEQRWQNFRKEENVLKLLANCLFGYLFGFVPTVIWRFGISHSWLGPLVGLLAFTITTAVLFRMAHKRLYPDAEDERLTHFLTILLSPATTIRAHDALSRPLLESFHPLAIAKVFCSEEVFGEFAARVLREIRHPGLPICPGDNAEAKTTEKFFRESMLRRVEEFSKRNGIALKEMDKPPARTDEECQAYCPRCLAQFTSSQGVCEDCGEIALVRFSK